MIERFCCFSKFRNQLDRSFTTSFVIIIQLIIIVSYFTKHKEIKSN